MRCNTNDRLELGVNTQDRLFSFSMHKLPIHMMLFLIFGNTLVEWDFLAMRLSLGSDARSLHDLNDVFYVFQMDSLGSDASDLASGRVLPYLPQSELLSVIPPRMLPMTAAFFSP